MKFLCDNCKAKYQIADDKVAGKTVRMKCRKCGHLIEIRASAALAEATAFRSLPAEELSRIVDPSTAAAAAASASASAPAPAAPAPAPRPAAGVAGPTRAAPAPAAGAPRRTTTTSPATAAAPAPRTGAPVRSIGAGASAGATKGATALARAPEPAPEPEAAPATGGLASAFSQSVGTGVTPDDPSAGSSFDMGATTAEEWYSGINGVPVGPMRLSELRSKIAAGLITDESLVWREGFEEWVALRTVPALVDLARSSAPNEKLSATPSGRRPSVRTSASNVVSLRPEAAEAPKHAPSSPEEHDDATSVFSGAMLGGAFGGSSESAPVAAGTPATTSAPATDTAASASLSAMADPFAAPVPVLGAAVSTDVAPVAATPLPAPVVAAEPAPARQAARIPAMAWVVVALALAVGVVGGTMLVPKPPADVTVQTVVVEKVVAAPTTATPDVTAKVGDTDPATDPSSATKRPVSVGAGQRPATTPTNTVAVVTPPPNSLPPLPGQNSPSPLPTSATPPTSTETIPAGKLQEIVSGQRNSLRRVCWDPYVSSGAATGSVKANVSLTIVNGQVTNVSVSGADARMSGCVQNRVRGWQFPTGFAPTNTSFVLAFVAQAQ